MQKLEQHSRIQNLKAPIHAKHRFEVIDRDVFCTGTFENYTLQNHDSFAAKLL
jgi:hypothetical protein